MKTLWSFFTKENLINESEDTFIYTLLSNNTISVTLHFFTILSQQNILSMIQNILSMIQNMYYYCSLCQDGNILLALQ